MATASASLRSGGIAYEEDVEWAKLPPEISFPEAAGVAVDTEDNVYLFNRGSNPVIVFDKAGNYRRSFGQDTFTARAHGIHVSPDGFLYCVDDSQHAIHKLTREGQLVWTLGETGKPAPKWSGTPFNRPTHVAVSPRSGDIFVTDGYGNARVHRFAPDGRHLLSWGSPGCEPGEFQNPHNLVVDADENVFVADRENNRVQVFDGQGKLQTIWRDIYRADAMCMGGDGTIYIGELNGTLDAPVLGHRLCIYDKAGARRARLGEPEQGDAPGQFIAIHGAAVDSQGTLYLAEVSYTMKGRREDPPRTYRSFRVLRRA